MEQEMTKQEMQNRIIALEKLIESFMNNATMPYELGVAMKARIGQGLSLSVGHALLSKTVNEGGVSSYDVAKEYDGMLITDDGKLIGFYNP